MIFDYSVSNYKIHKEHYQFEFGKMNLFTGTNNSGKTSLIQSIRNIFPWIMNRQGYNYLPIEAIEENQTLQLQDILNKEVSRGESIQYDFVLGDVSEENSKLWVCVEFNSSLELGIALGANIAIMTKLQLEYQGKGFFLQIVAAGMHAGYPCYYEVYKILDDKKVLCDFKITFNGMMPYLVETFGNQQEQKDFLFMIEILSQYSVKQKLLYISPFRTVETQMTAFPNLYLDPRGLNSAEILDRYKNNICYDGKRTVQQAFLEWTGKIMGVEIQTRIVNNYSYFVQIENGVAFRLNQTGLGISQLIPCILSVLLCQKGDIVIIENPEVHLHPKWKTELVDFYLDAMQHGIQIFLETQSLEIVNRVRRRAKENENIRSDTQIWFFEKNGFECNISKLEIQSDGGFDYWPDDFVDKATLEDSAALL